MNSQIRSNQRRPANERRLSKHRLERDLAEFFHREFHQLHGDRHRERHDTRPPATLIATMRDALRNVAQSTTVTSSIRATCSTVVASTGSGAVSAVGPPEPSSPAPQIRADEDHACRAAESTDRYRTLYESQYFQRSVTRTEDTAGQPRPSPSSALSVQPFANTPAAEKHIPAALEQTPQQITPIVGDFIRKSTLTVWCETSGNPTVY